MSDTKIANAVTVGDYVNYTYDEAEEYPLSPEDSGYEEEQSIEQTKGLKWRVLNINEDGSVDLISEIPTSQKVTLKGVEGYNNGVTVLNDICKKQYSNKELGLEARSIKIEDIEKLYNDDGIKAKKDYLQNQQIFTFIKNTYPNAYPNLAFDEIGVGINSEDINLEGLSQSEEPTERITGYSEADRLFIKPNFYAFDTSTLKKYIKSNINFEILFNTASDYFISSRCIREWSGVDCCDYSIFMVVAQRALFDNGRLINNHLTSGGWEQSCTLRPIVTLGSNFEVNEGNGSLNSEFIITK